jgi:RNA polymerase sigma factor for flagellar operon FliA
MKDLAVKIFKVTGCRIETAKALKTSLTSVKRLTKGLESVKKNNSDLWIKYWLDPSDVNRNELVVAYHPFCVSVVMGKFNNPDCVQEALIALINGVERYDGSTDFTTFIRYRLVGEALDYLRKEDVVPRLTRLREKKRNKLEEQGINPETVMNREEFLDSYTVRVIGSLDEIDKREDNKKYPIPIEMPEDDFEDTVKEVCKGLNFTETTIMYLYYVKGKKMHEIGTILGYSESRISQIHKGIMRRLRVKTERSILCPLS